MSARRPPTPTEIGWAHLEAENNRQRYLVRRAALAAQRRQRARSAPSGQAVDWRVTALALAASVVVLPVALVGYIAISAAVAGWRRITRLSR